MKGAPGRSMEEFGDWLHPFTGINMMTFYKELIENEGCEAEFVFSNNPLDILNYTKDVINCDIHTRVKTKENGSTKPFSNVTSSGDEGSRPFIVIIPFI